MNNTSLFRKLLILGAVFVALSVLVLMLYLSDLLFRVYDYLKNSSPIFLVIYFLVLGAVALAGVILIWRIWTFGRKPQNSDNSTSAPKVTSVADLQQKVETARTLGVDVGAIEQQIQSLNIEPQELDVAFFGKISTGKSSLIRTLVPNARVDTSIIGGSTSKIESYYFDSTSGLSLKLLDMPGTEQAGTLAAVDDEMMKAARRVHIVIYVIDQDLTATDKKAIENLLAFDKPMIVALNKINHYRDSERQELRERITSRLPKNVHFVEVASVYERSVRCVAPDGSVTWEMRPSKGDINQLLQALANLSGTRGLLVERNQQAIMHLTDETLNYHIGEQRQKRGETIVKQYSYKAMVGGMAAVGPGSDILIQGYLGVNMLKEITALYGISTKEIDFQSVMNAASGKLKSNVTIGLMLGGNICKAFPGLGTVVGGASHAVAYGFIFESLGKAMLVVLNQQGKRGLNPQTIADSFAQELSHDTEKRVKNLLKIALGGERKV